MILVPSILEKFNIRQTTSRSDNGEVPVESSDTGVDVSLMLKFNHPGIPKLEASTLEPHPKKGQNPIQFKSLNRDIRPKSESYEIDPKAKALSQGIQRPTDIPESDTLATTTLESDLVTIV